MKISDLEIQMSNLKEFRANIWKYGFSTNNLYDVIIEIPTGGALYKELQANNLAIPDGFLKNNLRLYTDEASMPGVQMSTGCLLYTSPSPRDVEESRMPSSA